jgi:hypothetical protein
VNTQADWSHLSSKDAGHRQKLGERHGMGPPSKRVTLADTRLQTAGLQNCERINFCCLKSPRVGALGQRP